jgi:hypothetical protein
MAISFVGPGTPLSDDGIVDTGARLSVGAAEVWTVLRVETSGCGFLADRRPKILFERHYFSRLTNHVYDDAHPDISNRSAGGYGAGGAHQYDRLAQAMALDEAAALQSASWGIGQVMGANFAHVGFADVAAMVAAAVRSEDDQLGMVAGFIESNNLTTALADHDWARFASGYNGPNYIVNAYDTKLADAYAKLSAGPLPNVTARAAQVYLTYLGYDPHGIDGVPGRNTYAALNRFQADQGLTVANAIDQGTIDALVAAFAV